TYTVLMANVEKFHNTVLRSDIVKLANQIDQANSEGQLEPPVIKWREYKAEQPHYEGRFLIYYEYNNNPNIRNIFIADYLPAEGRFMNVLNDIEILYWAEVQPPSL